MNRGIVAISIITLLLLAGCVVVEQKCPEPAPVETPGEYHELFEEDVLGLFDKKVIDSSKVTVGGVKLGDSFTTVTAAWGLPQFVDEYLDDNVVNARYDDPETNETVVIFNFENNKVHRINIRPGANDRLKGKSKIAYELADITQTFGKPDMTEDLSFIRQYTYTDLGLEIFHKRKEMLGYAFIPPQ